MNEINESFRFLVDSRANYTCMNRYPPQSILGKLKEFPQIMTQGETLEELEENIKDAYQPILEESGTIKIEKDKKSNPLPTIQ